MEKQTRVRVVSTDGKSEYVDMAEFVRSMNFANLAKIKLRDLEKNKNYDPTYKKFTKSQIVQYLENPAGYEKQLRQMSIYLYNISNFYRRLIRYFSTMSTFNFVIEPVSLEFSINGRVPSAQAKKLKDSYDKAVAAVDRMNIAHEFTKVLTIAFRDDIFYGWCWESRDSFSIQQLDSDFCKISGVEDGVYNFAFDFSYFDARPEKLAAYDPVFCQMYDLYKSNSQMYKWQELPGDKSICIKVNEETFVPIPPFVSLFSALADIEDYRSISKNASEVNNYKALALEIPIDEDGEFLIDYDLCKEFYNMLCNVLPPNIGAFMSPMKTNSWDFEKSGANSESDIVEQAENSFWDQAGVNKILFGGGEDPSSSTLQLSTINDQMIVFAVMRQIERWINRRLKNIGQYKFKIKFLEQTHFNKQEVTDEFIKLGTYGMPVRSAIMASMGFSPLEYEHMQFLENTFVKFYENEVPLKSSNTMSSDEVGRPTNASKGEKITDAGEASREQYLKRRYSKK